MLTWQKICPEEAQQAVIQTLILNKWWSPFFHAPWNLKTRISLAALANLHRYRVFLYKCVLVHEMWKSVQYIIEYRETFSCKGLSLEYTNHFDTSFSISRFLENFLVLFYNFYYKIFKYQSINSWLRWKSIIGAFL